MRWCALVRFVVGVVAVVALVAVAGCETGADPKPVSTFPGEDPHARDLVGHVRAGTEPIVGALVHVEPSLGYRADALLGSAPDPEPKFARTTATDTGGGYRLQFAPFAYDVSVSHGRELYVFHGIETRTYEPPFAADAPVSGFGARVVPTTDPPPRAGDAVAFFVSGADARTIVAAESGAGVFDARFREFESTITLHAVEYVAATGLAAAVAEGSVDIQVHDGVAVAPVISMTPVPTTTPVVFTTSAPPGYTVAPIDVEMDFGLRTSAMPVARTTPGVTLGIAVVKDARYFARARAAQGAAVSDSGRLFFNPFDRAIAPTLPSPVSSEAPIDDDASAAGQAPSTPPVLEPGGPLAARLAKGVIEHVLTPESGGGAIVHVATADRTTSLPDVTSVGLARPTGRYLWTLQHFPTLAHTDRLSGEDGRVSPPSWTSAPRVIVLR